MRELCCAKLVKLVKLAQLEKTIRQFTGYFRLNLNGSYGTLGNPCTCIFYKNSDHVELFLSNSTNLKLNNNCQVTSC